MQKDLKKTVERYMAEKDMIRAGDLICAGVSGGVDSVCLLRLLAGMRDRIALMAVHVNHQLRGAEAEEDARFVRELCASLEVPLVQYAYPVGAIAKDLGIGTEEAGRLVRMEAYRDCLKDHGASRIALAHHANDLAETFLFRAARGSSVAGLAAIRPVQRFSAYACSGRIEEGSAAEGPAAEEPAAERAAVIRPLLCVTREEIVSWMTENGYAWRHDATNDEDSCTRNGIRHHVMPYLCEHVNARTVEHLAEAAQDLEETDAFLRQEAALRGEKYTVFPNSSGECDPAKTVYIKERLFTEPAVIRGYILLNALEYVCGRRRDLGRMQIRQLEELFSEPAGKRIDLPYGMQAEREEKAIRLYLREASGSCEDGLPEKEDTPVGIAQEGSYTWHGWTFFCRILDAGEAGNASGGIPQKQYTKWMDYDKIRQNLVLRSRRSGDYLTINADGGTQKLKTYLINAKVPKEKRDAIPLLASDSEIWWAVGGRISEKAKVTPATKRILEITALSGPEKDSDQIGPGQPADTADQTIPDSLS